LVTDGAGNSTLPRWVESLDRRLDQGLATCTQAVRDLRDHVDTGHDRLSGEIATLRDEGAAGRHEIHQKLGEIETTGARRFTDLEKWRAVQERAVASADTAQNPDAPTRWSALRDVLRQPWPWVTTGIVLLVVVVLVALVAPAALDAIAQATAERIRGGG
jgi:hypothetical protein